MHISSGKLATILCSLPFHDFTILKIGSSNCFSTDCNKFKKKKI